MLIIKILKFSGLALVMLILVFVVYSFAVVFHAHYQTGKIISDLSSGDALELSVDDLSSDQFHILLTVEDPNFYGHSGYDLKTPGAGWTTITQALVKKYYFKSFKPGFAKIRQTLIAAFVLHPLVSKRNQLRLFINKMYLGSVNGIQVIGFADAARIYYDKEYSELTRDEYISIVAMLIAPKTVNIVGAPEANKERVRRIKNLVDKGKRPSSWLDVWLEGCK